MIRGIRVVLLRDLITYFTSFYAVGFDTLNNLLQVLLFAYVLSEIVPPTALGNLTYLQYFAIGSLSISIFGAAYSIGRDVYWDRDSGFLNYQMSLPLARWEIIIGHSLGGSCRALFTVLPLYFLALALVPTTILNVLESVAILFAFSIGVSNLSILIAVSVRENLKFRLLNTLVSLVLVRSSTAMYPQTAMPVWLQLGTRLNPVTYGSESIRSVIAIDRLNAALPLDISIVLLFSAVTGIVASWLYSKIIEGGPAE
jgi:ABC-type polysaccharide/polyol phosphate export permease